MTDELREAIEAVIAKVGNPSETCSFWDEIHRLKYVYENWHVSDTIDFRLLPDDC